MSLAQLLFFCLFLLLCEDSKLLLQQFLAFELCCVLPTVVIRSRRGRFVLLCFTSALMLGTPIVGVMLAFLHPMLTLGVMSTLFCTYWMLRGLLRWRGSVSNERQSQRSRRRSKEACADTRGLPVPGNLYSTVMLGWAWGRFSWSLYDLG